MSHVVSRSGHMPTVWRVAAVLLTSFFVTLGSAVSSRAQPSRRAVSSPDSARLIADLFFRAVADEKWEVAASMLDTTVIRRIVNQRLRQPPQRNEDPMTIQDFMRDDPNKPIAVAEYELKRYRDQVAKFDVGEMFAHEFDGVRSLEELRRLSTLQAAVRYLQAQDERIRVRNQAVKAGCADSTMKLPFALHRILATALANDTVAYLLHEDGGFAAMTDPGMTMDPMIMHLRMRNGRWVIVPTVALLRRNGSAFGLVRCDSTGRRR